MRKKERNTTQKNKDRGAEAAHGAHATNWDIKPNAKGKLDMFPRSWRIRLTACCLMSASSQMCGSLGRFLKGERSVAPCRSEMLFQTQPQFSPTYVPVSAICCGDGYGDAGAMYCPWKQAVHRMGSIYCCIGGFCAKGSQYCQDVEYMCLRLS